MMVAGQAGAKWRLPGNSIVFEVAWEVANKVGGIYTVIKTKAEETVAELGDRIVCVGPLKDFARSDVEFLEAPEGPLRDSIAELKSQGMNVLYGRWLIKGNPQVILMDLGSCHHNLGQYKGDFYAATQVECPDFDLEVGETVVFGAMVAAFLGDYAHRVRESTLVVAQFHEWQVGTAVPIIRHRQLPIALVFTTHATLLGRFLCAGETDFYNFLPHFDVDREAGNRGIYHRFSIERSACHAAHVFSTVSEITADEAQHLLKRRAEVVMPNGLNVVDELHEFQNLHAKAKAKIDRFVLGHFYGHYDFNIDKTLYMFTAGRYEFLNKGADVFLESLARLNHLLKQAGSDVTVVAFLIFPAVHNNYNSETLKGQGIGNQLRESVEQIRTTLGHRLLEKALAGEMPDKADLVDKSQMVELKRSVFAAKRSTLPPVVTHNIAGDEKDPVLNTIRRLNLFNDRSDRVKVIFHPQFLNKLSPIFPIDYDEFVRGCHLGVFPSYYEPWGYTPAECAVHGIPSITTNLSGFGRYMEDLIPQLKTHFDKYSVEPGIYIVDRRFKSLDESIHQLADKMMSFCSLTRRDRINQRNVIQSRVAPLLDWKELQKFYTQARRLALHYAFPDKVPTAEEPEPEPAN